MAEVFIAKRMGAHGFAKRVALKRILPQLARDPDFVAMFIEEARLAAQLEHPNIVHVFDFGEADGELFLAMELVDGTNINRLLRAVASRGEAVPQHIALHIAAETAHALAHAHSLCDANGTELGFVHRDVSPANILLTRTGHVKLTDFGIARVTDREIHTDAGHVRGKLGYMSPEQVMGKPLDGRSDVFTLAIVFAEMLLGEPLFGKNGSDLDILLRIRDADIRGLSTTSRRIPQDIRSLLTLGLAKDRRQRPSASTFAEACSEVIRRRGVGHGPERLSRLLAQLDLLSSEPTANHPGGRMTSLVDATDLSEDAAKVVGDLGPTSPAIYRIRFPDGREIGPLSFPRLVELITSGEVNGSTLIAKESDDFNPASGLPELTRFVTSPALQWSVDEISGATWRGDIRPGALLPVAHEIAVGRKTGVLHLADGSKRKKIYFAQGAPEFVASTDPSELLGEHLVASGMCMRMEVEMALALLPRYGGRLGDALVGLGVLRPIELFRAIAEQVRRRYLEAFRWRRGMWIFAPNVTSQEETFPLGQDAFELLRDSVEQADITELEIALSSVQRSKLRPIRTPAASAEAFQTPASWRRILDRVDGNLTLEGLTASVRKDGSASTEEIYKAVHFGLGCRLIEACA